MARFNAPIWRAFDHGSFKEYALIARGSEVAVYALGADIMIAHHYSGGNDLAGRSCFRTLIEALDWADKQLGMTGHDQVEARKQRAELGMPC